MNQVRIDESMSRTGVRFGTSGARGLVADMSDEVCYAYAAAFLQCVAGTADRVVLGHDLRPSSPRIAAACAAAIQDSGRQVVYAGALPTPALAFYAARLGAPTLVVTGSHIPFDRNGIKFYRAAGEISKADEQAMLNAVVALPDVVTPAQLPKPDEHAADAYIRRYVDFFGGGALAKLRVAVYEHSSVGRDVLRGILEGLGAQVISLGRTDVFVPIDTEAVRPEDVAQARQWAGEYAFDALVSTDGDADRPLIGDEQGNWLRGDVVGILCAQYLQAQVVVTPVSSNTAVEKCGSFDQVVRTRIGSPYVIAGMEAALGEMPHSRASGHSAELASKPVLIPTVPLRGKELKVEGGGGEKIVVGYEANGGFLLGSDVVRGSRGLAALPTRDAVLPMLALLCLARERGCKVSQLSRDLPARYTASDRLQNFVTDKSQSLIARLRASTAMLMQTLAPQSGSVAEIDQTDGLRVTFATGDIVHLRPSGNAPELRCYAEASTPQRAKLLCDECLQRVLSNV
ncbi:phosphoglucosamine mutase [mine drainage metagenome]|uniref:Phosphoglucosamine mutase n=1 Tax=mine drainage metagenome TaxID=410659 RepID=A0A1J5SNA0_9ZZZZ